jgi:hypothetical protein
MDDACAAGALVSRARFAELVEDLRRLDPQRIRTAVHAMLPRLAERNAFDAATATLAHAALCDEAARLMVKHELLAAYRDRVSGERPIPVIRVPSLPRSDGVPIARGELVKKAAG